MTGIATLVPIVWSMRTREAPAAAQSRFVLHFTPWLGQGEFLPAGQTSDTLTFTRNRFHTWQIVCAILLFPVGLVALMAEKQVEQVLVYFRDDGDGTTGISVSGSITKGSSWKALQAELDRYGNPTPG